MVKILLMFGRVHDLSNGDLFLAIATKFDVIEKKTKIKNNMHNSINYPYFKPCYKINLKKLTTYGMIRLTIFLSICCHTNQI